jgi:hypothetical protein
MIRWLVSLLLTVGLGVAPTEGTRPGVIAIYESGRGAAGVMLRIWADDVISADPRLAPVGRELLRFHDISRAPIVAAVGSPPQPYAAVRALLARGTPLAFGGMRLQSIERRALTDELTALPGPVLSREALTALLMAGPMGADPDMQDMPASYNGAYGEGNEFVDSNAIDEAVNDAIAEAGNDTYPE